MATILKTRDVFTSRFLITPTLVDDYVQPGAKRYGTWRPPALTSLSEQALPQGSFTAYTVTSKDLGRPDLIAYLTYSDVRLWWAVCYYNGIRDPLNDMYVGQVLRLPTKAALQVALQQGETYL